MNTTALLVDILIIGIQVLLWTIGIIFSLIFDINFLKYFFVTFPTISLFLFIGAAYTVGIVADHLIGNVFFLFKSKEEKELYNSISIIDIIGNDKDIHSFLNNQYERLRISRGTLLNIPMLTISALFFTYRYSEGNRIPLCVILISIFVIGIIFTFLAFLSWKSRNKMYINYIIHAKSRLKLLKN